VSLYTDVQKFSKKFGFLYEGKPRIIPADIYRYRLQFMREEVEEYMEAWRRQDNEAMLDALVDLVYVTLGTAQFHGFDFDEAWKRVHAANMKKRRATDASESKRGTGLDVVKPKGWKTPDLKDLL